MLSRSCQMRDSRRTCWTRVSSLSIQSATLARARSGVSCFIRTNRRRVCRYSTSMMAGAYSRPSGRAASTSSRVNSRAADASRTSSVKGTPLFADDVDDLLGRDSGQLGERTAQCGADRSRVEDVDALPHFEVASELGE